MDDKTILAAGGDGEIEIDLMQLLRELRKRIWMIIAVTILCGGLAGAFSYFCITPQYKSSSMMYIISKETTLTSLADLQMGSQLTLDYKEIVNSRPVLQDVVDSLGLDMTYQQLRSNLTIDNPTNTRILTITATNPDPVVAKLIVDEVASTSSEYIADIMELTPPKIIETGEVPIKKSSPNNTRNAMLGAMVGFVLVCGFICLEVILNDSVQNEEDVQRYLGLSVLATVPQRLNEEAEDKEAMAKNVPADDRKKKKTIRTKRKKS